MAGNAQNLRLKFVEPHSLKSLEDRAPKWVAKLGRNHLTARPKIAAGCIGCGRCVAHCPPEVMAISGGKVQIDYDKCIRCYCCQELCPENAVILREGNFLKLQYTLWISNAKKEETRKNRLEKSIGLLLNKVKHH